MQYDGTSLKAYYPSQPIFLDYAWLQLKTSSTAIIWLADQVSCLVRYHAGLDSGTRCSI